MAFLKALLIFAAFTLLCRLLMVKISAYRDKKGVDVPKPLTLEIIEQSAGKNLLQVVFKNLSERIARNKEKEYEVVKGFSKPQQAIFITLLLAKEVGGRGFKHFYESSNVQYAPFAPAALELVGAVQLSKIVGRANEIFKAETGKPAAPQDGSESGYLSAEARLFDELDEDFHYLCEQENLTRLQIDFIRKHQADFIDH